MRTTPQLNIDGCAIDDTTDCWVIAEVGHNHQGDLEKCKRIFDAAKENGASAVKLQKRDNRTLFTKELYNKPYDNENSFGRTYGEHREALEFGLKEYRELQQYCRSIGITFFATAFDFPSADFLAALEIPVFKLASGDLKNIPLLKHVAAFGKPMIVSTGGGSMEDVRRAYDAIMPINSNLAILQCTASYPTPPEEMNLRTIATFREQLAGAVIGLSDHSNGISMAVTAYMLGGRIIEKHFTLNHTWKGTDHAMSLEPEGLRKMVRDLKRVRTALGDGVKRTLSSEQGALHKMGKKIVAARELGAGHVLKAEDLAIKSPGDGLAPYEIDRLIGRKLGRALREDDNIRLEDME
jgi:N-acetylneuraminate synthase/sialic acid synthase